MRATYLTALVSGIAFGAMVGFSRRMAPGVAAVIIPFGFFTSVLVATVGLPQLKEMLALQMKHGPISLTTPIQGELRRVFVPAWLRGATWFIASGIFALVIDNAQKA